MADLPEELLSNILWQLKLSMGSHNAPTIENRILTKTLFSCMLASKTLYRLVKPVLYHTINHKDLFKIAQHLAHEPALADHVRELSAHERSCHDSIRIMYEDDARQWPEYLRDRISAFQDCFADTSSPEAISTYGFTMPIATFALLVCTKIHTLVMHSVSSVPPALDFIEDCLDVDPDDPTSTNILASLKKFDLRYPPLPRDLGFEDEDDDEYEAGSESEGSDWLSWFIQSPQLESITLHRLPKRPWRFQRRSPGPKRLTLTDRQAPNLYDRELEDILKALPMLECLDVT
jgi:hypothetical protein